MEPTQLAGYDRYTGRVSAKELSTLLKVSSSLSATIELAEVLQIAIESAADLLGLNTGAIYTLEGTTLTLGATTPPLPVQLPQELLQARLDDHPHIKRVVETKGPVYLEDARTAALSPAEKVVVDSRQLVSILYFPLLLKGDPTGVFIVGTTDQPRRFEDNEVDLCYVLSFQASLAIANAQLYSKAQEAVEDMVQAYDATLEGWSSVLDMRDHETDEHTRRVADLTVDLGRKMGIPGSELEHVRRGALLHDIGKMAIPDAILQKEEPLSEPEMAVMQTHPEKARQMLARIAYLVPDMDIPYCHHEKWDGSGYPRGLRGEQIPLSARIFAVVDVYDALTSERPYRKSMEKGEALAYIRGQSGKHFFPAAVDAFIGLMTEHNS